MCLFSAKRSKTVENLYTKNIKIIAKLYATSLVTQLVLHGISKVQYSNSPFLNYQIIK